MVQWTTSTQKTIDAHSITAKSYTDTMNKAGGFDKWVRSLGGVFEKWHGVTDKVKTVSEFQERCEYVQGLMALFRFCYWNGSTWYYWHNSPNESFYSSKQTKSCPSGTITQLCTGEANRTRITNCNYGVDTLTRALGCYKWCRDYNAMIAAGAQKVTEQADLQVGDIVHFFQGSIAYDNWRHVAVVWSVDDGEIVLADFGSRFIKTGNPHHLFPGEYTTYGSNWFAVRWMDLEDDTVREKTPEDRAVELRREIDAFLAAKQKEHGEEIFSMAQGYQVNRPAYLRAAADYVLNGYAGSGEARKVFFGADYQAVQDKVNWVITTAQEVISGRYGSGEARKAALGADYYVVQAQVNRILGR